MFAFTHQRTSQIHAGSTIVSMVVLARGDQMADTCVSVQSSLPELTVNQVIENTLQGALKISFGSN